jgi:hypothetical protein
MLYISVIMVKFLELKMYVIIPNQGDDQSSLQFIGKFPLFCNEVIVGEVALAAWLI